MKRKWKADEMEMAINFKAVRLSWVSGLLALVVWMIAGLIKTKELPFIPFMLVILQTIIFFASKLIMTRRAVGKEKDYD